VKYDRIGVYNVLFEAGSAWDRKRLMGVDLFGAAAGPGREERRIFERRAGARRKAGRFVRGKLWKTPPNRPPMKSILLLIVFCRALAAQPARSDPAQERSAHQERFG